MLTREQAEPGACGVEKGKCTEDDTETRGPSNYSTVTEATGEREFSPARSISDRNLRLPSTGVSEISVVRNWPLEKQRKKRRRAFERSQTGSPDAGRGSSKYVGTLVSSGPRVDSPC